MLRTAGARIRPVVVNATRSATRPRQCHQSATPPTGSAPPPPNTSATYVVGPSWGPWTYNPNFYRYHGPPGALKITLAVTVGVIIGNCVSRCTCSSWEKHHGCAKHGYFGHKHGEDCDPECCWCRFEAKKKSHLKGKTEAKVDSQQELKKDSTE